MSELPPTGDHAALVRAAQGDAALCTIVGIDGSFSRRVGTQLAVAGDGSRAGDMSSGTSSDRVSPLMVSLTIRILRKSGQSLLQIGLLG